MMLLAKLCLFVSLDVFHFLWFSGIFRGPPRSGYLPKRPNSAPGPSPACSPCFFTSGDLRRAQETRVRPRSPMSAPDTFCTPLTSYRIFPDYSQRSRFPSPPRRATAAACAAACDNSSTCAFATASVSGSHSSKISLISSFEAG